FSFKALFQPKKTPDDELNQAQREAIVDLLNYCSFLGDKITASESEFIDSLPSELHWDESTDFDFYENQSVGIVRGVLGSQGGVENFLKGVRDRLDSEKSRALALALVDKLIRTSGKTTPEETEAREAITRALR
ncbi:MAG TPA: hypothetical protein VG733_19245, partial [Chthoniobacteraceae bacterium]|nr:hypothetical protein [Chthoniobacteraceae bacterium]